MNRLSKIFGAVTAVVLTTAAISTAQNADFIAPAPSDFGSDMGDNETGVLDAPLDVFASKPFRISASLREGWDSNVFTTKNDPISSFYTNASLGLRYDFGSPRLKLTSNLGGGVTYYYSRPGDKIDYTGELSLDAVYLATPRLTLSARTRTAYLSQPDLSIVGGTNRVDGDYFYTNTAFSGAYQWTEKLSSITGYNITAFYYVEDSLNDTQGRVEQTISQSINYLLLPKTTVLAEYRANPVIYYEADQNSFGNFLLLGFDQTFNPRFIWNLRGGVEQRFLNNQTDGKSTYLGPYGESTLTYKYGPRSNIAWNARYGTEASGLTDVTQRQTFRTGLVITHGFTPRLNAVLGFNYQVNYYDQQDVIPSFYENIFDASLAVNFQLNRLLNLNAGYQFITDIAQQAPDREYVRNVVFFGATANF